MNKDQWQQKMQSVVKMRQPSAEAANGAVAVMSTEVDKVPTDRRCATGERRCASGDRRRAAEDRRARPTETAPPIRPIEAHGTCCEWSLPTESAQLMARQPHS